MRLRTVGGLSWTSTQRPKSYSGKGQGMRESFIRREDENNTDHYRELCDRWRILYRDLKNHEELEKRFSLRCDEDARYITYFNREYRLDKKTGMLTLVEDPDRELVFNEVMAIYHLFYYVKPRARVRGEFVPFRQVKRAAPFESAYKRTILKPLAAAFDGHLKELKMACVALGGEALSQGDVGYRVCAFDCMPLELIFWDGDEEFPAQANILFDADITDFLHEETVVMVAAELFRRLVEESGLEGIRQPLNQSKPFPRE